MPYGDTMLSLQEWHLREIAPATVTMSIKVSVHWKNKKPLLHRFIHKTVTNGTGEAARTFSKYCETLVNAPGAAERLGRKPASQTQKAARGKAKCERKQAVSQPVADKKGGLNCVGMQAEFEVSN